MRKKNLDKLFQEKLKDFSEVPDKKVWQSIEASLDEKKKSRKVIPFWWKLGGVAAILAIALWVINPFDDSVPPTPSVTDIENTEINPSLEEKKDASVEKNERIETDAELVNTNRESEREIDGNTENSYVSGKEKIGNNSLKNDVDFNAPADENTTQVTDANVKNLNNSENQNKIDSNEKTLEHKEDAETAVAVTNGENHLEANKDPIKNTGVQVAQKDGYGQQELPLTKDADVAQVEEIAEEEVGEDTEKKSIFDEIASQEEEKVAAKDKRNKWSAGPSVAPVYFDAIGEGSPVHSIFVPNSKSGELNLSYGLSIAYEISDKLSIRSGLHKVDFGYDTNEVEFSSSLESIDNGQIANINYAANSKNLVVASSAPKTTSNASQENFSPTAADVSAPTTTSQNGVMSQQFGYLEVPVELEYALVDKKIGVNLIGGVSSLFLVDNSISLTSGDLTTQMGEANNVNNVNFSTNVGVGVNYKVTPTVQFNIEPVFKYQLNTFSETDGTFQPFSVGVYSGVNFKF